MPYPIWKKQSILLKCHNRLFKYWYNIPIDKDKSRYNFVYNMKTYWVNALKISLFQGFVLFFVRELIFDITPRHVRYLVRLCTKNLSEFHSLMWWYATWLGISQISRLLFIMLSKNRFKFFSLSFSFMYHVYFPVSPYSRWNFLMLARLIWMCNTDNNEWSKKINSTISTRTQNCTTKKMKMYSANHNL